MCPYDCQPGEPPCEGCEPSPSHYPPYEPGPGVTEAQARRDIAEDRRHTEQDDH